MKKSVYLVLAFLFAQDLCAQAQWALDTIITVGTNASGIDITPDGSKLVVSCKTNPGTVKILNTTNYAISTVAVSSFENNPDAVRCAPGNSLAIVATLHKLLYINLSSNTVSAFTAPCAGTSLYGLAISASGAQVYFPDLSNGCTGQGLRETSGNVAGSSSTYTQVSTGGVLTAVALNNSGSQAMITAYNGNPRMLSLSSGAVTNVTGLSGSYGIAALHNSSEYLLFDGDSVVRINTSGSIVKKIAALSFNTSFQNIAITSDDKYAFVMGAFEKLVITLADNKVIQTFSAGGTNVACMPDGSRFFVTDYFNGTVRVYKKTSGNNIGVLSSHADKLLIYPNPGTNGIFAEFTGTSGESPVLSITDITGKLILQVPLREQRTALPVTELSRGLYFYEMHSAGETFKGKLLIE